MVNDIPVTAIIIVVMVILALVIRSVFGLGSRRAEWDESDQGVPPRAHDKSHDGHELDYYLMERDLLHDDDRYYNDQDEEDFLGKQ